MLHGAAEHEMRYVPAERRDFFGGLPQTVRRGVVAGIADVGRRCILGGAGLRFGFWESQDMSGPDLTKLLSVMYGKLSEAEQDKWKIGWLLVTELRSLSQQLSSTIITSNKLFSRVCFSRLSKQPLMCKLTL